MDTNITDCLAVRFWAWLAILPAVLLMSACETMSPVRSLPRGLQGAGDFDTVVVDAGHGGHDSGAKAFFGAPEKQLTLDTSRRLARILRESGLRVVETRTGDFFVPLDQRVAKSNALRNAIFVSIHYNWVRRAKPSGIEVFYFSPSGSRLAANIEAQISKCSKGPDRGIKQGRLYVLRNNRRPAVLCELGFVSNPRENRDIQTAAGRQLLAEAVARGILAEKAGRHP